MEVEKIKNSGKKGTKRCVSETKKKYVASKQNWKCFNCEKKDLLNNYNPKNGLLSL